MMGLAWALLSASWLPLLLPLAGLVLSQLVQAPGAWLLNTQDIRKLERLGQRYRSYEWPRARPASKSESEPASEARRSS